MKKGNKYLVTAMWLGLFLGASIICNGVQLRIILELNEKVNLHHDIIKNRDETIEYFRDKLASLDRAQEMSAFCFSYKNNCSPKFNKGDVVISNNTSHVYYIYACIYDSKNKIFIYRLCYYSDQDKIVGGWVSECDLRKADVLY